MALTKEQISTLKKQLLEQVKHLSEPQKKEAESQIESLSEEAIESMLESQKISQTKIFREIVSGNISSKKISENNEAIAVLDIKPISKGHTIIIPKNQINEIEKVPKTISEFSQETAKTISEKLGAEKIKIVPEIKFGEVIINLIPIYKEDMSPENNRLNSSEEELNRTLEKINKKEEKVPEKIELKEEKKKEKIKLKKRIP